MIRRPKFDLRCILGLVATICFVLAVVVSFENWVVGFLVTLLLGNFCAAVVALLIVFFVRRPEPNALDDRLDMNPAVLPECGE